MGVTKVLTVLGQFYFVRLARLKVSNMVLVKNSLVDSFPCVFKMSKMAGFLPFKKGIDEATGYQIAHPLCSLSTMGILALSKTVLISFLAFGIYLSTSQADISLMELLKIVMVDINEPGFDTITFLATFFSVQLLNAGIEYGIFCLRKTLPDLHRFYAQSLSRIMIKKPSIDPNIKRHIWITATWMNVVVGLFAVGIFHRLVEETNSGYWSHLTFGVAMALFTIMMQMPMHVSNILIGELVGNLCIWSETLRNLLVQKDIGMILQKYFDACYQFYKGLEKTCNVFSNLLGVTLVVALGE